MWGTSAIVGGRCPAVYLQGEANILNSSGLHPPEYRAQLGQCPRFNYPTLSDCSTNNSRAAKMSSEQQRFFPLLRFRPHLRWDNKQISYY
ncbi:hypothetical protein Y032_0010g1068 [Ancylostoma ceylanicum]|uniref:Uncharacterized protein n=1 Tax=Ancylostoma ceylanicum TaxID=53326 RepID=A0A016VF72_9BILA|nr:hypothetical protein Y032_0010g1068 [Ancylostoma ceylanicum]